MNTNANLTSLAPVPAQEELARIVRERAPGPGLHESSIQGMEIVRADLPGSCTFTVYEPSIGFVIQGRKTVQLGDREIEYGPLTYGVSAVHLPVTGSVKDASPDRPYLAVKLRVNPQEVADLVLELGNRLDTFDPQESCPNGGCGLCMTPMDEPMQHALARLLRLLDVPDDITILAPLARREIIYRALTGPMGPRMRHFVAADSQAYRIARAIAILRDSFSEPLRVRELAEEVNMSESSLFHTFKQVTRMSPLQFLKKLRLHEARRLMLAEGLEAATASYRVGYESPSQFSREYSRMFGAPPREDVTRLRGEQLGTPA